MSEALPRWSHDGELFERARRTLYSAVIGDILDGLGMLHQFLPQAIQPLRADFVVCGRVMTVLEADDEGGEGPDRHNPTLNQAFGMMLRALDDLKTDEVYLCTGASPNYALWGELMSMAARNRGAVGAVLDGWSRDTTGILAQNFPCFSRGRYAQDQRPRGKVVDFRCRLKMGAVTIEPGDIVFGDIDGAVIVPSRMADGVFRAAFEKASAEKRVFEAIKAGMGAQAAWDRFGVL